MKNLNFLNDIKKFLNNKFEFKYMTEDLDNWIRCINKQVSFFIPVSYKSSFIQYQELYFKDVYEEYMDLSMVLYRGGRAVGLFPFCIYKQNGVYSFGSNGGDVLEPVFVEDLKPESINSIIKNILIALKETVKEFSIDPEIRFSSYSLNEGISLFQRKLLELCAVCQSVKMISFVDLSNSYDAIQRKMRRTNKYSINKGNEDYNIDIIDGNDAVNILDSTISYFREFHIRISGRETRSVDTWLKQLQNIKDLREGTDFVVSIKDRSTNKIVGMALFAATKLSSYYAVGVYDRERFKRPVGHVVQAYAIKHMQSLGIRWYELGDRYYPFNKDSNEKLLNISFYKEGFATNIYPKIVYTLNILTIYGEE